MKKTAALSQQKQIAGELDRRVAQRTIELGDAHEELGKNIVERGLMEEKLRQEEQELKQSEARKAAILESALDCIVTIDHEGCITEFNPAAEHTFGYRRVDVMGRHLADIMIPPALREKHRQGFARYLATGEARVLGKRIEMTAVRADGSEFPVELAITRIPLDGPPSFTGYLRDITERKRAEQALRRSEAFLAEGQHLGQIGSYSWRVATDEITWSAELYRIYEIEIGVPVTLELIRSRVHPAATTLNGNTACGCRTTRSSTCMRSLTRRGIRMGNWSTSPRCRMSRRAGRRKKHETKLDPNLHMWPG
jgi:PAS domain S-box-containing protein